MTPRYLFARTGLCLILAGCLHSAALGATNSDKVVKVTAAIGQPDSTGKQEVTITLQIAKGWHIYANPVGQKDFPGVQTSVSINAATKPLNVQVVYPQGKAEKDPTGEGDYYVYEDRAVIRAVVQRAKGDTGPLEVSVRVQACTNKTCLMPATIKLTAK